MQTVALFYWAGAKAAAGVASESVPGRTVAEALATVVRTRADDRFSRVVQVCSLLIDGVAAGQDDLERELTGPVRVDVLPPFAGGAPDARVACAGAAGPFRPAVRTSG